MKSFVAQCFQHFKIKVELDVGMPFLILVPNFSRFLFTFKWMKINVFQKTSLGWSTLTIHYSFISTVFYIVFFQMNHMHAFHPPPIMLEQMEHNILVPISKNLQF
jgi:glucan phosphoethanolaminetransferase (alkaline phosphatase superfamily)